MCNFTMNSYEMKRDILNFSKKVSEGVNKSTSKFVMDMQFGLAKSGSCLISEISRSLNEDIKLNYTIERLCDNLNNMYDDEKELIWNNYLDEVKKNVDLDNPIVLFDDSDINKEYSRKLEDLDRVIDASSQDKRIVNGYHVCEATILTKNEKQPLSIYSQIYSCKSKNFESKNKYTIESIKTAEKEDVIKIVRLYLSRWRIEEHFRGKKQEYDFENMRVRTLKAMNNLNMMLTIHLGYIAMLVDKMDKKLLVIKIIEASKSLRNKVIVWLSQMSRGIKEILKYCHTGIKEWQDIEQRPDYKQLQLKL